MELNFTQTPEIIISEPVQLVYLEKHGPFMQSAPAAWHEFSALIDTLAPEKIKSKISLTYTDKTKQGDNAYTYQAGVILKSQSDIVNPPLAQRTLSAAKYASFLLIGSYAQLSQAYPAIFEILTARKIEIRDDFCMEKYLNDYATTPESELRTEILIPVL